MTVWYFDIFKFCFDICSFHVKIVKIPNQKLAVVCERVSHELMIHVVQPLKAKINCQASLLKVPVA